MNSNNFELGEDGTLVEFVCYTMPAYPATLLIVQGGFDLPLHYNSVRTGHSSSLYAILCLRIRLHC